MARTLNVESHAVRREAFVDAAERLIQAKGYEQTSVSDVLDALDASRGAFYHYFDSKSALLEAVVDRMVEAATATVAPIVADPNLTATEKLHGVFSGIARWKGERTELLMALMRVWLADDNAIVREKLRRGTLVRLTPLLARIVEQGVAEGVFTASSPGDAARVLVALLVGINESALELWFARQADIVTIETVERTFTAYAEAFERILGAPSGSIAFVDPATVRQWYG
jgi:AcrR family transcriptional regulator